MGGGGGGVVDALYQLAMNPSHRTYMSTPPTPHHPPSPFFFIHRLKNKLLGFLLTQTFMWFLQYEEQGRETRREKKGEWEGGGDGGGGRNVCVFPQRDRKPSCGITGSQRVMGGSGPRYQNMEPSGRSLWSAREKKNGASWALFDVGLTAPVCVCVLIQDKNRKSYLCDVSVQIKASGTFESESMKHVKSSGAE